MLRCTVYTELTERHRLQLHYFQIRAFDRDQLCSHLTATQIRRLFCPDFFQRINFDQWLFKYKKRARIEKVFWEMIYLVKDLHSEL